MAPLVVLEPNRLAAQRIARVLSAAAGMASVLVCEAASELPAAPAPALVVCGPEAYDALVPRLAAWPHTRVILCVPSDVPGVLARIRGDRRARNVVAWPSFLSTPRPWELLLAARRLVDPLFALPKLQDLLAFGAHVQRWMPATTTDRDRVVEEGGALVSRAGIGGRTADRVSEVLHELVMNAMYDAPVDGWGQPRYAADRRQDLTLEPAEVPTVRLAFDGTLLAIEAADPFGRLRDEHVIDGILRGAANQSADAPVLDTSHGGAGLGMWRVHAGASALFVDVRPLESTRVLWFFDVDLNARDARGMPSSLHLFRTESPDPGAWP
jgi:hypothetical protein